MRTLLTDPLESLSIGNTIILSKSLIDTASVPTPDGRQQQGNLNALLAFQIAHILSGHHLDTKFAFNDTLLFPDNTAFRRFNLHHSSLENQEAAARAITLLSPPQLAPALSFFGLYLEQLAARAKALHSLNEPELGDSLMDDAGDAPWLAALLPRADRLEPASLTQQAATPLGSFLRFDPWTDRVVTLPPVTEPLLSPSDKMPFEVRPVYIKLAPYTAPADAPPSTN